MNGNADHDAKATPTPADPRSDTVTALLAVNRMFVAVATNALAGLAPEVTLPQFRTLVLLDESGPLTVTALAYALGVVPSTATRMCDRLVAKKLVRRAVDRGNRRRVTISLAGPGRALLAESTARRRRELTELLSGLSAEEQNRIAEALGLLTGVMRTRATP